MISDMKILQYYYTSYFELIWYDYGCILKRKDIHNNNISWSDQEDNSSWLPFLQVSPTEILNICCIPEKVENADV